MGRQMAVAQLSLPTSAVVSLALCWSACLSLLRMPLMMVCLSGVSAAVMFGAWIWKPTQLLISPMVVFFQDMGHPSACIVTTMAMDSRGAVSPWRMKM